MCIGRVRAGGQDLIPGCEVVEAVEIVDFELC
jgi:hypothetical protein